MGRGHVRLDALNSASPSYGLTLLYDAEPPPLDGVDPLLAVRCPGMSPSGGGELGVRRYRCAEGGGLDLLRRPLPSVDVVVECLRHTLGWSGAFDAIRGARSAVLVYDGACAPGGGIARFDRVRAGALAVHEVGPALAVMSAACRQFVDPDVLLDHVPLVGEAHPLLGAVNVRVWVDEEEEMLDTVGLSALGLPDLQCHMKSDRPEALSRASVAELLYETALGMVAAPRGPVPETLDDSGGVSWTVRIERAIAPPARVVLDLGAGRWRGRGR